MTRDGFFLKCTLQGLSFGAVLFLCERNFTHSSRKRCIVGKENSGSGGTAGFEEDMQTILVVEDDISTNRVICEVMKDQGYHVLSAKDGQRLCQML